ncbi:MAG: XdhC family protein [Rubellimicrobium sp.]|nr:XdhC family protein [Rubellimicrobium sp.]
MTALAATMTVQPHQALQTDDARAILTFARDALAAGRRVALVTLTGIVDGAARALGAHMAVADDGGYCGYISGGCVESAVAAEALLAISAGADRVLRLGKGSDIFDIRLPCRGGIVLSIHVLRDGAAIGAVLDALAARQPAALAHDPAGVLERHPAPAQTGWQAGRFVTAYRPPLRVHLLGQGIEAQAFVALAAAAGIEIAAVTGHKPPAADGLDAHSAVVLLQHDLDRELPLLRAALASPAFYIGCLGSKRTHDTRLAALRAEGWGDAALRRIRAPVGLFGPARDARSIAVSVLAEILSLCQPGAG